MFTSLVLAPRNTHDDRGSVVAEYSVLLSLILGTVIVAFFVLGSTITGA